MKAYIPERALYRYTRFRKSVEELLNSPEYSPILACQDFKITPKQFFEEEYWLPVKLRRQQGREGKTQVAATSYKEVLFSSKHSDICLILGNTGAGKTTWQLKAVFDCVEEKDAELAGYVPVWVDCSTNMNDLQVSLPSEADTLGTKSHFLACVAKTAGFKKVSSENIGTIEQILQQNLPILFLVDLNNAKTRQRARLAEAIENYVRDWTEHDKHKMIIAYRLHSEYAGDSTYETLRKFITETSVWTVQPLELNSAKEYYQKYKRGDKSGQEFAHWRDFIQHSDVVETPLLLHLLTTTEFSEKETRTLGQLYEKVVENLLNREKDFWVYCAKGDRRPTSIPNNLLAKLALDLVGRDQLTFSRDELIDILEDCVDENWFPQNIDDEDVFDEIIDKTILRKRGQESLAFIHDSFAYFFAAYSLRYRRYRRPQKNFVTEVCERIRESPYRWMEPMRFLGGLNCRNQCDELINALLQEYEESESSKPQFLMLATNFAVGTPDNSISNPVLARFIRCLIEVPLDWRLQR